MLAKSGNWSLNAVPLETSSLDLTLEIVFVPRLGLHLALLQDLSLLRGLSLRLLFPTLLGRRRRLISFSLCLPLTRSNSSLLWGALLDRLARLQCLELLLQRALEAVHHALAGDDGTAGGAGGILLGMLARGAARGGSTNGVVELDVGVLDQGEEVGELVVC